MRKSKFKVLSLVISLVLAVGCLSPLSVNGQNGGSDGFFRGGSDSYENREDGFEMSGGITNDSFGAPLGSGLIIMVTAGASYAAIKRKSKF